MTPVTRPTSSNPRRSRARLQTCARGSSGDHGSRFLKAPPQCPVPGTLFTFTAARPGEGSVTCRASSQAPAAITEDVELKAGIANFYDASSALWEDMWGEHMHHGYYGKQEDDKTKDASWGDSQLQRHQKAQILMIEKSLDFADVTVPPSSILDAGCGIGGSARYLANKYSGSQVRAMTLSPRQAQRGNEICKERGLQDRVQLAVADVMNPPFPDASFDLLWSMESGEHMPDKTKFVGQLARLARPGGKVIIVTWCHRNLNEGETELKGWEKGLLDQICDAYYLPAWCSADDYVRISKDLGLTNVKSGDWTEYVTPFWPAVIASALSVKGFIGLLKSGWTTMRGALAMLLMVRGYSQGLIKFVIITAEK